MVVSVAVKVRVLRSTSTHNSLAFKFPGRVKLYKLQAGPATVLRLPVTRILQLHPSPPSRSRGREGLLVHVLEVLDDASDLGIELDPPHGYVRSHLVH